MEHLSGSRTGQETAPRQTAVGFVLGDLQHEVERGTIAVGERLPSEAALAQRYGVSRSVIREVLRASAALGLTVTRTGKGTFVVGQRPAQLIYGDYTAHDLLEARPHIEVPAAGLAALRRTPEQLATIERLTVAMNEETDPEIWAGLDTSFHLCVAEASGNAVLAGVVAAVRSALGTQSRLLNRSFSRRRGDSNAEHRGIATAIARGSAVEAEDAMSFHLGQVHDAVADLVTESPSTAPNRR